MLRWKINCICLGLPRSRFSRITRSKKILPLTGRSSTWVYARRLKGYSDMGYKILDGAAREQDLSL
jgi:hypothetical protein